MSTYSKKRSLLLGENISNATHKLRKHIMFAAISALGADKCYRCNQRIVRIEDFSIEHKAPWQSALDPKTAFFDLNNIAFSHLTCNVKAGGGGAKTKKEDTTPCPYGHTEIKRDARGRRRCMECKRQEQRAYSATPAFKAKRREQSRDRMRIYMRQYRAKKAA